MAEPIFVLCVGLVIAEESVKCVPFLSLPQYRDMTEDKADENNRKFKLQKVT